MLFYDVHQWGFDPSPHDVFYPKSIQNPTIQPSVISPSQESAASTAARGTLRSATEGVSRVWVYREISTVRNRVQLF